jgi:hypothetical protein
VFLILRRDDITTIDATYVRDSHKFWIKKRHDNIYTFVVFGFDSNRPHFFHLPTSHPEGHPGVEEQREIQRVIREKFGHLPGVLDLTLVDSKDNPTPPMWTYGIQTSCASRASAKPSA